MFAYCIDARPIVFRELLVDDGDTGRVQSIGRQEAAAAQNRYPHRFEVSFVDGVHCRSEAHAIARHLNAVRHESEGVKGSQPERRVLRESDVPDSGHCPSTAGQKLIELLRPIRVVLHQTRVEPG